MLLTVSGSILEFKALQSIVCTLSSAFYGSGFGCREGKEVLTPARFVGKVSGLKATKSWFERLAILYCSVQLFVLVHCSIL